MYWRERERESERNKVKAINCKDGNLRFSNEFAE
jgi:hypothetical protein